MLKKTLSCFKKQTHQKLLLIGLIGTLVAINQTIYAAAQKEAPISQEDLEKYDANGLINLGEGYYKRGNFKDAKKCFNQVFNTLKRDKKDLKFNDNEKKLMYTADLRLAEFELRDFMSRNEKSMPVPPLSLNNLLKEKGEQYKDLKQKAYNLLGEDQFEFGKKNKTKEGYDALKKAEQYFNLGSIEKKESLDEITSIKRERDREKKIGKKEAKQKESVEPKKQDEKEDEQKEELSEEQLKALWKIGYDNYKGSKNNDSNYKTALKSFTTTATQTLDPRTKSFSDFMLGVLYFSGSKTIKPDYKKAIEYAQPLADNMASENRIKAHSLLGRIYYDGLKKNQKAKAYFTVVVENTAPDSEERKEAEEYLKKIEKR